MKQSFFALIAGLVFGLGLVVSQMIHPAKILAFLDVAGNWDPSLIIVMGSALLTTGIGYRLVFSRKDPLFSTDFKLPEKIKIDARLVLGAALFGVGWGISGLCPGPAITGLLIGSTEIYLFLLSMVAGVVMFKGINRFIVGK
ncbi:DUF6691 family protein [Kiloniella sp.]|uniref:DUF6691 family protein n=1 Tax=Kiloniella sp. TaxID=1938587 RepID=UPI003A8E1601